MKQTASIMSICQAMFVPCVLENPATSMLWKAPPILKCSRASTFSAVVCDQCAFGTPWRKRTRLGGCHIDLAAFDVRCTGRKGICCFTNKHHILFQGASKEHKCLWTSVAQSYSARFSRLASQSLISAADSNRILRLNANGAIAASCQQIVIWDLGSLFSNLGACRHLVGFCCASDSAWLQAR